MTFTSWKNTLKAIPFLGPMLTYIKGNFLNSKNSGKKNSTFFSYKRNIKEDKEFEITKINTRYSLYMDRLSEVKSFFHKNSLQMLLHFIMNGTPNTNYYRYKLYKVFQNTGLSEDRLKLAYEKSSFMYVNRLMLRYHNYRVGMQILEILDRLSLDKDKIDVLDYGCGVADPSLYLALSRANVTIVDLDDDKFDFAVWRFKKRNLKVNSIGATQTEKPVDLGDKKYDVIIMAEFLEHVRNPRLFLEYAVEHLNDNHGVLYDSLGKTYLHGAGGDHLIEAKEVLDKTDYAEFFNSHLCPLNNYYKTNDFQHFYIKTSCLESSRKNGD